MKWNLRVLVLLVAWSLLFLPSLVSDAHATQIDCDIDPGPGPDQNGAVEDDDGAGGDDSEGDPGDAGDGYGISDPGDQSGPPGGYGGYDRVIIDELRLILMSLVQLAR